MTKADIVNKVGIPQLDQQQQQNGFQEGHAAGEQRETALTTTMHFLAVQELRARAHAHFFRDLSFS